jgi:hypothetical protein
MAVMKQRVEWVRCQGACVVLIEFDQRTHQRLPIGLVDCVVVSLKFLAPGEVTSQWGEKDSEYREYQHKQQ